MIDNSQKFLELREKYKTFIYDKYVIEEDNENIKITYYFEIENLQKFNPTIKLSKKQLVEKNFESELVKKIVFNIGLVELISYWKCTCSPNVIIKCGYIDEEQINWFKKLYFYGLGELFYTNNIKTNIEDFMDIKCIAEPEKENNIEKFELDGYIIPVGGGKDSVVTLETLKNKENKSCLIINPKPVTEKCAEIAGYDDEHIFNIQRTIDKRLIELNSEGFINGHTPFSALLAFVSYLQAFITGKKYIALSNESSANESNVRGEKVNHQYSKSIEFENDFRLYAKKYFKTDIEYFSFLRPLNELQIAMLFSKKEKYHKVFKSCNQGSKQKEWAWCCECPKCLFAYIILSPFLYREKLVEIFGQDLYEKETLLQTFIELAGYGETKPFECVGTYEEVNFAISKTISNLENRQKKLPFLLKYYKNNFKLYNLESNITKLYNEDNNLPSELNNVLRDEIKNA